MILLFVVILRTVILLVLIILIMRLMGKRQIGQMQPYEISILIIISALAAIPMEDIGMPLLNSIVPILILFSFQMLISYVSQKSEKVRAILCGRPSVVIENGTIVESELQNLRMNLNELYEMLRVQGSADISDVEFAIFETNGQLSIIPKSQSRPITPTDFNLETNYEGLPHPLIIDGNINYENLHKVKLNEQWLRDELSKHGIKDITEVLLASLDTQGNLFFQVKE